MVILDQSKPISLYLKMGVPSKLLLGSVISLFTWISKLYTWILLQAITTLLCLLLVLYVLVPSIYSFLYLTTALLGK